MEAKLNALEKEGRSADPVVKERVEKEGAALRNQLNAIRHAQGLSDSDLAVLIKQTPRQTTLGVDIRFVRYQNGGGRLLYKEWYDHSRGGRRGGEDHQAIQNELLERGVDQYGDAETEVEIDGRWADCYWPSGPNGKPVYHQIGGLNPSRGDPIARERRAIEDIRKEIGDGAEIWFWDKTKPGASAPALKDPDLKPGWHAAPR